jgi:branched-chain amino acid transport system ATP-binding protein
MTGLSVRGLHRHYGGVAAVDGVDLEAPGSSVTVLIGPNGAGKTTLFQCVTGLETADAGSVVLGGDPLDGMAAHERSRRGLAWTFQRLEIFAGLTVEENVRVGAENRHGRPVLRGLLGLPDRDRAEARQITSTILDQLGLTPLADVPAGSLPTGTMRLVELGRALASGPSVLLLDEPASGLDDDQIARLALLLRRLADSGIAVLVVEHDMRFVFSVADHVYVMASGRILVSGTPEEVRADPAVQRVYLDSAVEF